jgi:hypothetical protein
MGEREEIERDEGIYIYIVRKGKGVREKRNPEEGGRGEALSQQTYNSITI